jgi:hypothetical protein
VGRRRQGQNWPSVVFGLGDPLLRLALQGISFPVLIQRGGGAKEVR